MKTYLVMRFSAMGDVILLLPVLVAACEQNPNAKFVVLTRPKFSAFFEGYSNIEVFTADVDQEYKSFTKLFGLAKKLKKQYQLEAVLDLHQHLRTSFLKLLLFPIKSFTLDKGRAAKKALTRKKLKVRNRLPHTTERYAQVLRGAGLSLDLEKIQEGKLFRNLPSPPLKKESIWIGIAPFAQHKGKMWPLEKVQELVSHYGEKRNFKLLLFGGGSNEKAHLEALANPFSNVESLVSKYSMKEELAIISELDVMVCMDSSNMHLAALAGVPTISIWGATHPDLGFGPFGLQKHAIVEVPKENLECRPCSVYGNKPCFRGDYACLNRVEVEEVSDAVRKLLS